MSAEQNTQGSQVPIVLLKEGTSETKGDRAQKNNITAAKTVAEVVRTSLGPRGMDKMIVSPIGDVTITNDGATILKEIEIEHPAAKMLVEVAKSVDNEVGDGTTSAVVVACALIEKAEELITKGVHPTVIVEGFKKASQKAIDILRELAIKVNPQDMDFLSKIAQTSMGSKIVSSDSQHLSSIVVDSTLSVLEKFSIGGNEKIAVDMDNIKVEKKAGGSINDSKIVRGVALDKEVVHNGMPKRIENAKIALLTALVEERKVETDKWVFVEGCKNPKAVSILIRGGSQRIVDEAERSVHDAIMAVKDTVEYPYALVGGGAPETIVAQRIREWSSSLSGRTQLAAEKSADSIETIPLVLAENAGMDPLDTQVQLRTKATTMKPTYGVDVLNAKIADLSAKDIYEPLAVKEHIINAATEAANMILRIDNVISASQSKMPPGQTPGGYGGGAAGEYD
jgi:chaperonin GroEL (HSP60 family)